MCGMLVELFRLATKTSNGFPGIAGQKGFCRFEAWADSWTEIARISSLQPAFCPPRRSVSLTGAALQPHVLIRSIRFTTSRF